MSKKGPKARELQELQKHLEKRDEKHDKHLQEKTAAQDEYLRISPDKPKSKVPKHYTPNRRNAEEIAKSQAREIQEEKENLEKSMKGHVKKIANKLSSKAKKHNK